MRKNEFRTEALRKMEFMQERFAGCNVPVEVSAYFRLCHLVYLANLSDYFSDYGLLFIDESEASAGRELLGWGPLSAFERDVIRVLHNEVHRREAPQEASRGMIIPLVRRSTT